MRKLEYTVSFNTPAFLGNAEQQAQWRTPPFKALIRQWWRVVHAPSVNYDAPRLRRDEAVLFGSASDEKEVVSGKSLVRLRLSCWDQGAMKEWQPCGSAYHPEVNQAGQNVGADLYLGYGPLAYERGKGTVLGTVRDTGVTRTTVEPMKALAALDIICPDATDNLLKRTMQLIAWFGTLGSRSRNGWGSLTIEGKDIGLLTGATLKDVVRPIEQCLHEEWAHAIGLDTKGPLVWRTAPERDWRKVIKRIAEIKIAMRTEPSVLSLASKRDGDVSARHILAYPLTNHAALGPINLKENEAGWVDLDLTTKQPKTDRRGHYIQSVRLANQIRFKVAKTSDAQLQGIIVHLPCKVPNELVDKLSPEDRRFIRNNELNVWQSVHKVLDKEAARLQ